MGREAGSKGGARWRSRLGVGAAMMVLGCLIAVGSGSGAGADYPPGQYIVLEKTVIPGDDPFACPGINGTDELVVGDGVPVVYCFRVVNTDSNVKLCSVEVVDYLLAINQDDMTLVEGDDTVGLPPGPQGNVLVYAYATTVTGDLLNSATATALLCDHADGPLPGAEPASSSDTAEVKLPTTTTATTEATTTTTTTTQPTTTTTTQSTTTASTTTTTTAPRPTTTAGWGLAPSSDVSPTTAQATSTTDPATAPGDDPTTTVQAVDTTVVGGGLNTSSTGPVQAGELGASAGSEPAPGAVGVAGGELARTGTSTTRSVTAGLALVMAGLGLSISASRTRQRHNI